VTAASTTAGHSSPTDPPLDWPGKFAATRIVEIIIIVGVLATYGRHLAQTLEQRAVARGFATIARFFGTVKCEIILAHIQRGLMRAVALERILMARAMRGGDLRMLAPLARSRRAPAAQEAAEGGQTAGAAAPETLTPAQAAAAQAADVGAGERLARRIGRNEPLTLDTMPRVEAIEAEVRRSPVGRTIAAICLDFGISPMLCNGLFWTLLFDAIGLHRGSASGLVLEVKRREARFNKEEWKHPGLELAEETRDGTLQMMGFCVGDPPVWPIAVVEAQGAAVAAAATGPP